MSIFLLSLAGLPPLAGFFGKFYLFSAAFRSGTDHGLLWLVALALFGSLISLYYYLIVLKVIFVDEASVSTTQSFNRSVDVDLLPKVTISLLAAIVLFLGLMPQLLVGRIMAALVE
jgi:NADH-quinone oxidoreductase subunit N